MQRLFVRLLLGVVVILQLFASGVPAFVQRLAFSSSEFAVVSEVPVPQQKHLQAKRMAEAATQIFILAGLIATMAFWSKVEFQWRRDDGTVS